MHHDTHRMKRSIMHITAVRSDKSSISQLSQWRASPGSYISIHPSRMAGSAYVKLVGHDWPHSHFEQRCLDAVSNHQIPRNHRAAANVSSGAFASARSPTLNIKARVSTNQTAYLIRPGFFTCCHLSCAFVSTGLCYCCIHSSHVSSLSLLRMARSPS